MVGCWGTAFTRHNQNFRKINSNVCSFPRRQKIILDDIKKHVTKLGQHKIFYKWCFQSWLKIFKTVCVEQFLFFIMKAKCCKKMCYIVRSANIVDPSNIHFGLCVLVLISIHRTHNTDSDAETSLSNSISSCLRL